MEKNKVYNADIFDKLPQFDDNSLDAIVTDPPYNLKFMGKSWDDKGGPKEFQEWNERWASIAYDKLKPGGWMIVFGGTKTYHRMVSGVEDAGFEIKDMIEWMYGTGFPKSYNISKGFDKQAGAEREKTGELKKGHSEDRNRTYGKNGNIYDDIEEATAYKTKPATDKARKWQGWGTALKPAHEPLVLAQKPREGTYCNNVEEYGCGGLNIDDCRVATNEEIETGRGDRNPDDTQTYGKRNGTGEGKEYQTQGRFPANLVLSHHPDCDEDCVPSCPVRAMNEQSGYSKSNTREPTDKKYNSGFFHSEDTEKRGHEDEGGAARYFNQFHFRDEDFFRYTAKASKSERTCDGNVDNDHPTVKPLELMEWLVRLVTPPEGVVVDPFCGSGTTLIAAYEQGFDYIGLDKDEDSVEIARERLDYHQGPKQKELV